MIDLRSDTLTQPTEAMRQAMYMAEVGDDSRTTHKGHGEDPTVLALEDLACDLTRKEAALFCNSGTMANYIGLLSYCKRGDKVLLSKKSHIYRSEKAPFMEDLFGLVPVFYNENKYGIPDVKSIEKILQTENIKMLCIENTNNYYGGTCIPQEKLSKISALAKKKGIPAYLDGARIFNASVALDMPLRDLCIPVDSLMFCLSKGLGAPVGSVLCGSTGFIEKARKIRKLLGGAMRQAGILAAAGMLAIEQSNERIMNDHENAKLLAKSIESNSTATIDYPSVQTNIVRIDISNSGFTAQKMEEDLFECGLKIKSVGDSYLRMTVYDGIRKEQISKAAEIFNTYIAEINTY